MKTRQENFAIRRVNFLPYVNYYYYYYYRERLIVRVYRVGRVGEGAGTIIGEMGTRKRRKSPSPAISTGERGLGEEHDSSQGQEEGKSHAQNVGARTVLIKSN